MVLRLTPIALSLLGTVSAMQVMAADKVTFDDHVKAIFREHCVACHNDSDKESGLSLESYAGVLAGGSGGESVEAGSAGSSRLIKLVEHAEQPVMPPDEEKLSAEKLAKLRAWVDQGLLENAESGGVAKAKTVEFDVSANTLERPAGPPPMPSDGISQSVRVTARSIGATAICSSPWAPLVAVGGQDQVNLLDARTGEVLVVLPFSPGVPQSMQFSRDGQHLLVGGGENGKSGRSELLDVQSTRSVATFGDEIDTVLATDISPNKLRVIIGGPKRVVKVFDVTTGALLQSIKKHSDWVTAVRFSPDGKLVATADRTRAIYVWDAETWALKFDLSSHSDAITAVDFRSDSNVLVSASVDGKVKLWDMQDGKEVASVDAHPGGAMTVCFAQDNRIVSGGRDKRVVVWDVALKQQREIGGFRESVLEATLSSEANTIIAGDWSGDHRLFALETADQFVPLHTNPPLLHDQLLAAQSHLDQLLLQKVRIGEKHEEWLAQLTQAKQEADAVQTVLEDAQKRIGQLNDELNKLDKAKSDAKAENSESPEVSDDLSEDGTSNLANDWNEIERRREELTEAIKDSQKQVEEASRDLSALNNHSANISKEVSVQVEELETLEQQVDHANPKLDKLRSRAVELDQAIEKLLQKGKVVLAGLDLQADQRAEETEMSDSKKQLSDLRTTLRQSLAKVEAIPQPRTEISQVDYLMLRGSLDAAEQFLAAFRSQ